MCAEAALEEQRAFEERASPFANKYNLFIQPPDVLKHELLQAVKRRAVGGGDGEAADGEGGGEGRVLVGGREARAVEPGEVE